MLTIRIFIRRILFFLYLLVIAWASLSPPDEMPHLISFPYFDKVAHFMMYLIFSIAGIWALDVKKTNSCSGLQVNNNVTDNTAVKSVSVDENKPVSSPGRESAVISPSATESAGNGWIYLITFLFALAWGLAMELLQRAMHLGRDYSMADLAANIAGALSGAGLYYILSGRRRQNTEDEV